MNSIHIKKVTMSFHITAPITLKTLYNNLREQSSAHMVYQLDACYAALDALRDIAHLGIK